MPNANYRKGRAFEYELIRYYKRLGWVAMRTSGSHGPFDVITISPEGTVYFIQCKVTKDETHARYMINKFKNHLPLVKGSYTQMIQVKIPNHKPPILVHMT